MRKAVSAFICFGLMLLAWPSSAQEEIGAAKVAVIDLQEIAQKSAVGQSAQEKLRTWFEGKKKELDSKERSIQQELANLENQKAVLTTEAYSERKNTLEQQALAFKQEQDAAQRELERRQAEALDEFAQVVGPVIEQVGKDLGLTVILDRRTGVYYFDRAVDITNVIIERLNAANPTAGNNPGQM